MATGRTLSSMNNIQIQQKENSFYNYLITGEGQNLFCINFYLDDGFAPIDLTDERCIDKPFSVSEVFDGILKLNILRGRIKARPGT